MPRPMPKRQKLAPGQERSLTINLKSLRNPPIDITLKSQSPLTSILDLKTEVSSQASIPVDKIRILYQKKPVGDAKVLKDLVTDDVSTVELSVMVMGGAASVVKDDATAAASVAQGPSGTQVLATQDFWDDLKGFLTQRLKDQAEGQRVYGIFRKAWDVPGATGSHESP
jgi:ubiquitin-like protein 4